MHLFINLLQIQGLNPIRNFILIIGKVRGQFIIIPEFKILQTPPPQQLDFL